MQFAALEPLKRPVFRGLWLAWLAANMTMWMNDVAAAWLMTSLTTSPVMVALVQTASTLPVFLLGLPSGAMADILDRRRYFAITQLWVSINALVLAALSLAGALTAHLLLVLTCRDDEAQALWSRRVNLMNRLADARTTTRFDSYSDAGGAYLQNAAYRID